VSYGRLFPILFSVFAGILVGVGAYTFIYAKGGSYFTSNPAACANCHIMNEEYSSWLKSSHRAVAACNDCHTPPGLVPKYLTKASNGFWHSFAFTSGNFPEPLRIKPHNREITERACRHCHGDIVTAIEGEHPEAREISCVRCHRNVGH
jgi:cytochrome c nitrite reductase small subunit